MAQYSCKWNSHSSNLVSTMDNLRGVENFVDVTLVCEGRAIKAHKLVLSTCSPLFHQMFLSNPCTHPVVFLADVRFTALKAIVDFAYRGEVSFAEVDLEPLLVAARALEVKGLTDICREKLLGQAETTPVTRQRSPRKKVRRERSVEEEDLEKEAASPEVDEETREKTRPQDEESNIRIKQALRSLCSAKKMSVKQKQKITGDPMDRRTSFVWNFFTPVDNTFARCKTCKKNISRKSSISNLKKHLENRHSNIVLESFSSLVESTKNTEEHPTKPEPEQEEQMSVEQESERAVCAIETVEQYEHDEQLVYLHEDPNSSKSMVPILVKFS